MTNDGWKAAWAGVPFEVDDQGWSVLEPERYLTMYVAHGAASLTIAKVEAIRVDGTLVRARTRKGEVYVLGLADLVAIALDPPPTPERKAGFSSGR